MVLCLLVCHLPLAGFAQSPGEEPSPAPKAEPAPAPAVPGLSDMVSKSGELTERLNELENKLMESFDEANGEKTLAEIRNGVVEIAGRLKQLKAADAVNLEKLTELETDLRKQKEALKNFTDGTTAALTSLETIEKSWREEKNRLNSWKEISDKEALLPDVKSVMSRGQQAVKKALTLVSKQLKVLVAIGQKTADVQEQIRPLAEEIEQLFAKAQQDIFAFSGPPMYTLAFFAQFETSLPQAVLKGIAAAAWPSQGFFTRNSWLLLFHLLVMLAVWAGIFRHKRLLADSEYLRFLASSPLAAGVLISTATLAIRYDSPPANWTAFLWIIGSMAAARTIRTLLADAWEKRLVYGLSLLLTLFQVFNIFNLPAPLLRLFLFGLSVMGLLLCLWRIKAGRKRNDLLIYTLVLRVGVIIFLVVLAAEVLGYCRLALHVTDAALKSFFLGITPWMFAAMVNGLMAAALQSQFLQKIRLVNTRTNLIIAKTEKAVNLLLGLIFFFFILVTWKPSLRMGDALQAFLNLGITIGAWHLSLGLVIGAIIIFYGSILMSRAVQTVLTEEVFPRRQVELGVRLSIVRLIHYAFITVGFLLALTALGFNLQNITIIGGALGIGIGFGLQTIVSNFVSGLILLFERPIKVGDIIQLDQQQARVKKVGLRATVVETFDNAEIVVPNSDLISGQVTNWTLADRMMRVNVPIGVAYGSDVLKVKAVLTACAEDNSAVRKEPPPQVVFIGFGESSLDFQLRVWISDAGRQVQVMSDLNFEIESRFRQAKIEIPFPQRDLHLRSIDAAAATQLAAIIRKPGYVPE